MLYFKWRKAFNKALSILICLNFILSNSVSAAQEYSEESHLQARSSFSDKLGTNEVQILARLLPIVNGQMNTSFVMDLREIVVPILGIDPAYLNISWGGKDDGIFICSDKEVVHICASSQDKLECQTKKNV